MRISEIALEPYDVRLHSYLLSEMHDLLSVLCIILISFFVRSDPGKNCLYDNPGKHRPALLGLETLSQSNT